MPFISQIELSALKQHNDQLGQELATFEDMRPHLQLAGEIREQIVSLLNSNDVDIMSTEQIGELAYQSVLQKHVAEARDEVAARYEQQHRRSLYERVLGEIATKEGDSISEQVKQKVETDPKLALELQTSARQELAARAKEVVRHEITDEQSEIVNREAKRQIALDQLDVQLVLERELDLSSEDVKQRIKPGDKVELFFQGNNHQRERIVLTWTKDANGHKGWVYTSSSADLVNTDGYDLNLPTNRFVSVGCVNKDLEKGSEVIQTGKLVLDLPLAFIVKHGTEEHSTRLYAANSFGYGYRGSPVILSGSDFQTKDIVFNKP